MRRWMVSCGTILAVLLTLSAEAANPRVTLRLENVTASEAITALSDAAEIDIWMQVPDGVPGQPPPPVRAILEGRSSFRWRNTRFADALRQVCGRYGLERIPTFGLGLGLYHPDKKQNGPPVESPVVGEKSGVKFRVQVVSRRPWRTTEARDVPPPPQRTAPIGTLSMELRLALGGIDADRVAGVTNVSATDDLGTDVRGLDTERLGLFGAAARQGAWPDQTVVPLGLSLPHIRASKLVRLEGDLIGYQRVKRHRVEVPYPFPADGQVRIRLGNAEVNHLSLATTQAPDGADRTTLHARYTATRGDDAGMFARGGFSAQLIGVSGKVVVSAGQASSMSGGGGLVSGEAQRVYQRLEEPILRAVVSWVECSGQERLFRFRLKDIPLPPETTAPEPPRRDARGEGCNSPRLRVLAGPGDNERAAGSDWVPVKEARDREVRADIWDCRSSP